MNGIQPYLSWSRTWSPKGFGGGFTIYPTYDFDTDQFVAINAGKIDSSNFNETNHKLSIFNCYECALKHEPPKYDIQTVLNQLTGLSDLQIGLDLAHNQSLNDILPNKYSHLHSIDIKADKLTIKSGGLTWLEYLYSISFNGATIDRIERDAFKTNYTSNFTKDGISIITFRDCNLEDNVFQNGSFDGIEDTWTQITFESMNVTSLPEGAFKSFLDDYKSVAFTGNSTIDCDDCKNYWLIKERKERSIMNAHCKGDQKKTLFDVDTKTKLSQKCK